MENFGNLIRKSKRSKEPGLPDISCKTIEKGIYRKVWQERKASFGNTYYERPGYAGITTSCAGTSGRNNLPTGSPLDFGNTEVLKMHVSMRLVYLAERILHNGFWKGI